MLLKEAVWCNKVFSVVSGSATTLRRCDSGRESRRTRTDAKLFAQAYSQPVSAAILDKEQEWLWRTLGYLIERPNAIRSFHIYLEYSRSACIEIQDKGREWSWLIRGCLNRQQDATRSFQFHLPRSRFVSVLTVESSATFWQTSPHNGLRPRACVFCDCDRGRIGALKPLFEQSPLIVTARSPPEGNCVLQRRNLMISCNLVLNQLDETPLIECVRFCSLAQCNQTPRVQETGTLQDATSFLWSKKNRHPVFMIIWLFVFVCVWLFLVCMNKAFSPSVWCKFLLAFLPSQTHKGITQRWRIIFIDRTNQTN